MLQHYHSSILSYGDKHFTEINIQSRSLLAKPRGKTVGKVSPKISKLADGKARKSIAIGAFTFVAAREPVKVIE